MRHAAKENISIAGVLRDLKLTAYGSNYGMIKDHIARLSINTSHFKGTAWSAGQKFETKPVSHYLVENGPHIGSHALKLRLFALNLKEPECESCRITNWLGKPAPLELDHINGVRKDNRLTNLRILCANCHALTDTYCGRNIKIVEPHKVSVRKKLCSDCGSLIQQSSKRCRTCARRVTAARETRITWPSISDLLIMIDKSSVLAVSKQLGVSDTAVRKRLWVHGRVVKWNTRRSQKSEATAIDGSTPSSPTS